MKEQEDHDPSSFKDLFLHPGHTWVDPMSFTELKVGIDGLVLRLMGQADHLILPDKGAELQRGSRIFGLRKGNRVINLVSPVAGMVLEINPEVASGEGMARLKADPYGTWIVKIRPYMLGQDLKAMRAGKEVSPWMKEEERRIETFLHDRDRLGLLSFGGLGLTLGDGGAPADGALDEMDDRTWHEFCRKFLGSKAWVLK